MRFSCQRKGKKGLNQCFSRRFQTLQPFQLLPAALGHFTVDTGNVLPYILLGFLYFPLLRRIPSDVFLPEVFFLLQEIRIFPGIFMNRAFLNITDAGADLFQEIIVVGDYHKGFGKSGQIIGEPLNVFLIQEIGRFIQKQNIRFL